MGSTNQYRQYPFSLSFARSNAISPSSFLGFNYSSLNQRSYYKKRPSFWVLQRGRLVLYSNKFRGPTARYGSFRNRATKPNNPDTTARLQRHRLQPPSHNNLLTPYSIFAYMLVIFCACAKLSRNRRHSATYESAERRKGKSASGKQT